MTMSRHILRLIKIERWFFWMAIISLCVLPLEVLIQMVKIYQAYVDPEKIGLVFNSSYWLRSLAAAFYTNRLFQYFFPILWLFGLTYSIRYLVAFAAKISEQHDSRKKTGR